MKPVMSNQSSALSPFKYKSFLVMWIATLVSNIGTWMHSVGAGWLMTELSSSALLVSLVQTATTLPVFIFALPAGTLADLFDKHKMLLIINSFMLSVALLLAILVLNEMVTPILLLALTFLLGIGTAFMAPTWQAVIPSLIPKKELPQAVALGSISINVSRAIGPALSGVLIATVALSSPFFVNAITFVFIIVALFWLLKRREKQPALASKRFWPAIKVGVSHSLYNPALKATMLHILVFMIFANAFWALLPVIIRDNLGANASYYGLVMSLIGIGAVITALYLPKIKNYLTPNRLVLVGTLLVSLATLLFALVSNKIIALILSFTFGCGWMLVLSTINVSAQQALPEWVRARGLAVFMVVFFGGMSLGSVAWGWIAEISTLNTALISSAIGGIACSLLIIKFKLQQGANMDLSPSRHWPTPQVHTQVENDKGPVKIIIHYKISEANRDTFLSKVKDLKASRRRNGAYNWGIYEDTEVEGHFIEHFMEVSWAHHLMHHENVTNEDKPLLDEVKALDEREAGPTVKHYLYRFSKSHR
ncbi:MAG: MFS transporter [Rickettsiales bacterium]|nr:MFS transporter [Rickettsiales bacterium]